MQQLECELKKFAQLDKLLKIKLDSGFICQYEKFDNMKIMSIRKLWHFFEIYLTVHDEPDFCDIIPSEKIQG